MPQGALSFWAKGFFPKLNYFYLMLRSIFQEVVIFCVVQNHRIVWKNKCFTLIKKLPIIPKAAAPIVLRPAQLSQQELVDKLGLAWFSFNHSWHQNNWSYWFLKDKIKWAIVFKLGYSRPLFSFFVFSYQFVDKNNSCNSNHGSLVSKGSLYQLRHKHCQWAIVWSLVGVVPIKKRLLVMPVMPVSAKSTTAGNSTVNRL